MNNLSAIKGKVNYPISDDSYEIALNGRGLLGVDSFDYSTNKTAFDLAYADCLSTLSVAPNSVSEGGFSISVGDRDKLQAIANRIYIKYGEASPVPPSKPGAKFVQKM